MPENISGEMGARGAASLFERNLAGIAILKGDHQSAWIHLNQALNGFSATSASTGNDTAFVAASLEFANICFMLGKGFEDLMKCLQYALPAAKRIGDLRSQAMICLHLGRLFYFAENRERAMECFAAGESQVKALGDEDIIEQAAELIGLFYFIQGQFSVAIEYFERAAKHFEQAGKGHSGPMWLSYCAAFLGQYHRAIGTLDYYRRLALERGDQPLSTTLRAVLGIVLTRIRKNKEAAFHLSGALQEARQQENDMAVYFAKGGLAFQHMQEGRLEDSRTWLEQGIAKGAASGLVRQYASPFVIETLYEFHKNGMKPIPALSYPSEIKRLLAEPNIHLKGVALRLIATEAMDSNENHGEIESNLKESEACLKRSGDPVQLAKTHIAMVRHKIRTGDMASARALAKKAWKGFSGYEDVFYPDDLRTLLSVEDDSNRRHESPEELVEMFTNMIQDLIPTDDGNELLSRVVKATNRFFGAERGGVFWFARKGQKRAPLLRAACNLSNADVSIRDFRDNLSLIFKAYRENSSQVIRHQSTGTLPGRVIAMVAIPFSFQGETRGILYHDNTYVKDCFDYFDNHHLMRMADALTQYIDQIMRFTHKLREKVISQIGRMGQIEEKGIVAQSAAMKKLLQQADTIACTSSTVLILGETGVGKELLARRIHNRSSRSEHPLITVDVTAMPETLVESELFGHEKGAFTGAEKQKPGRLELAHKGTLFIDEVGEIPMNLQVKLLRALQERTMTRLGGTTIISSDFRLIAATNRNLMEEVSSGRFREDLFYRLNVIPIVVPPLRERKSDILLLARHFMSRFSSKYNRQAIRLKPEDESALTSYGWPGNVRELQNVMERAVLLSSGENMELHLPTNRDVLPKHPFDDCPTLDEVQRRYIQFAIEKTGGKIGGPGGAAEMLGMKRTSLYNRMRRLELR